MRKRRLAFDQLETRTALCAAFGGVVAAVATEGIGLPTEQGKAADNASEVGGYKSGGHKALFDSVSDAVQFQLKEVGGACNPTP
jgi:hypothetical protein